MLKLMKYEFKQNTLSYLGIFLVFLSLSFAVPVIHRQVDVSFLSILLQTLFVVLAAVIVIGIFINAGRTYLDSMFKHPGYLTMTLPVSTHQLILSKIIPSLFWMIISIVVVAAGIIILVYTSFEAQISVVFEAFGDLFSTWFQMLSEHSLECILYVAGLLGALCKIMMSLYMCLTITHTSWIRHHRVAVAIGLFIGIHILSGNISFNGDSVSFVGAVFEQFVIYDFDSYFQNYTAKLAVSTLLQWIQCLIPYAVIWFCLEKKLEIQ